METVVCLSIKYGKSDILSLRLYKIMTSASSLSFVGFDKVSGHVGKATANRGLKP